MKLKYTFESMELEDRIVTVPVGEGAQEFRGVIKLNDSALEIFELLKADTTEEAIAAELVKRHGNDPEIPGYVHEMVECLKGEGVLE